MKPYINIARGRRGWARRREGGFTAVEVTMVAAVIAILTLIALPIFRKRVEEARVKGCEDEMAQIARAQELAYAETGFYFRLNDLDNMTSFTDGDTSTTLDVPVAVWNRELNNLENNNGPGERWFLCHSDRAWNGPYMAFRNFAYLADLRAIYDTRMFRDQAEPDGNDNEGPILLLDKDNDGPGHDLPDDKYPLDPWGNPYFFFGGDPDSDRDGKMIPNDSDFERYPKSAIVSMGPNGRPGGDDKPIQDSRSFQREGPTAGTFTALGEGDDIVYEF